MSGGRGGGIKIDSGLYKLRPGETEAEARARTHRQIADIRDHRKKKKEHINRLKSAEQAMKARPALSEFEHQAMLERMGLTPQSSPIQLPPREDPEENDADSESDAGPIPASETKDPFTSVSEEDLLREFQDDYVHDDQDYRSHTGSIDTTAASSSASASYRGTSVAFQASYGQSAMSMSGAATVVRSSSSDTSKPISNTTSIAAPTEPKFTRSRFIGDVEVISWEVSRSFSSGRPPSFFLSSPASGRSSSEPVKHHSSEPLRKPPVSRTQSTPSAEHSSVSQSSASGSQTPGIDYQNLRPASPPFLHTSPRSRSDSPTSPGSPPESDNKVQTLTLAPSLHGFSHRALGPDAGHKPIQLTTIAETTTSSSSEESAPKAKPTRQRTLAGESPILGPRRTKP